MSIERRMSALEKALWDKAENPVRIMSAGEAEAWAYSVAANMVAKQNALLYDFIEKLEQDNLRSVSLYLRAILEGMPETGEGE